MSEQRNMDKNFRASFLILSMSRTNTVRAEPVEARFKLRHRAHSVFCRNMGSAESHGPLMLRQAQHERTYWAIRAG